MRAVPALVLACGARRSAQPAPTMHVVDACGGRAVAAFPVIAPEGQQVWAASARFRTGTNDLQ